MRKGWLTATAAAAVAATAAGAAHNRRWATLTKPLPMALLAARVAADRRIGRVDRALALGAIGLSMAGDYWMLREEFEPAESSAKNPYLRRGAAFFSGAQICYQAGFARRGARYDLRAFAPRMAAMGEPAAILTAKAPSALPVLGPYGALLAGMSTIAADDGPKAKVGGLLFQASDIAIINRRHLLHSPGVRAGAEAWVLGSYFAAQYLLVDALLDR
ncbi:MAG: lysoplasmalogenase family protein [Gordonia sp. (in: high G+C Gram-positive bacteria)]|uniref:lysoplasmalogenase family protein n=1 Tax=Gordonia sp. (in: high G+C Gram-positive bacteria) TaxID=84139 RepID=UPI0039E5EE4B